MKNRFKKVVGGGVCLAMAAVFVAGCTQGNTPGTQTADPETRPFVIALGATDGNFSPFFATAQYDTQVTELTQISMLSADPEGNIAYGENEPCAVLDYTEVMRDANGNVTDNGDEAAKTEYEFLIKNGIKFSDGKPLTIKDILFNLYVYLDPVYFGSSTIYSTDIIGLTAYRSQDPTAAEDSDISNTFISQAQSRVNYLSEYLEDGKVNASTTLEDIEKDIETLKQLYREEVTSDWTSNYGSLDSYTKEYSFTTNWEVYYFNERVISVIYDLDADGNRKPRKDSNGKYVTTLDNETNTLREEMNNAKSDKALINKYMSENGCSEADAIELIERDTAIKTVYEAKASSNTTLASVLTEGWASASNLLDKFSKEAMTEYYDDIREQNKGELLVKSIKGIQSKTDSTFNGKSLGASHEILHVEINGVDPKAIWNFAFQVAPVHYYSGEYKGKNYAEVDIPNNQFGVCFGDSNFFDSVLNNTEKSKLPVGAGVYKASNANGTSESDGDRFHNNKVTYYMRNDNFETLGSGINNAKIKYVRYREVEDASLVQVLKTGEVDYGEPSASPDNVKSLQSGARVLLGQQTPDSASYGYVGINAKFIPDIEVRQAIMSAMNIMETVSYYGSTYAKPIYRPMSMTNWVHKEYLTDINKVYYTYERDANRIWDSLYAKGWRKNKSTGVGYKGNRTLKYTFTIAGGTEDHPAFTMFKNAAAVLNRAGFDITVMTSTDALKSLATGALTVWAAAYTSPVDPDLYQVYHKDSKATSVKNWGYDSIKSNTGGLYDTEQTLLTQLSDKIEEGRKYLEHSRRGPIYKDALEKIMELAIQLPTYQRKDLAVYNRGILDNRTLNLKASAYAGVLNKIWEVNYNLKTSEDKQ